jgi:hypothetical protein
MTTVRRTVGLLLGVGLLGGLAGCGDPRAEASNTPVQPVKGRVVVGSQPLAGGQLKLSLQTNKDKYGEAEAVAMVQPDGTFEPRQVGDRPGLVEGRWKVVIDPVYVKNGKGARVSVPARYTTGASDLTIDVPAGGAENVTVALRP